MTTRTRKEEGGRRKEDEGESEENDNIDKKKPQNQDPGEDDYNEDFASRGFAPGARV